MAKAKPCAPPDTSKDERPWRSPPFAGWRRPNYEILQEVSLAGGVAAVLTPVQRNQFYKFCVGRSEFLGLQLAGARLEAAMVRQGSTPLDLGNEIVRLAEDRHNATLQMMFVALNWLDDEVLVHEVLVHELRTDDAAEVADDEQSTT